MTLRALASVDRIRIRALPTIVLAALTGSPCAADATYTFDCLTHTACYIATGCEADDLAFAVSLPETMNEADVVWNDMTARLPNRIVYTDVDFFTSDDAPQERHQLTIAHAGPPVEILWTPAYPRGEERTYNALCDLREATTS